MILKLLIDTDETAAVVTERLALVKQDASRFASELVNYVSGMAGGVKKGAEVQAQVGVVKSTGTVTLDAVDAADTVTVGGTVLTAVSGAPDPGEFDISGTDAEAATSLAEAINASAAAAIVVAVAAADVVTLTSVEGGVLANQITLASSNGTRLAVSGTRLTGGADATKYVFDLNK
jgi:hypothetical protein